MAANPFDRFDPVPPRAAAPPQGANPFDQFGAPPAAPQGNVVSRALRGFGAPLAEFAAKREVQRPERPYLGGNFDADLLDAAARVPAAVVGGTANFAADLASKPLKTIGDTAHQIATSPARLYEGSTDLTNAALRGDIKGMGSGLEKAGYAGLDLLSVLPAGRAAALARGAEAADLAAAALPKPRAAALKRLVEADPELAAAAGQAAAEREMGLPATTADFASRQAQGAIKSAARRPGPAQDIAQAAFDPRQAESYNRLASQVKDAFGVNGDFLDHLDALKADRAVASGPLYFEAYRAPTSYTDKLKNLLTTRPSLKAALAQADRIARDETGHGIDLKGLSTTEAAQSSEEAASAFRAEQERLAASLSAKADELTERAAEIRQSAPQLASQEQRARGNLELQQGLRQAGAGGQIGGSQTALDEARRSSLRYERTARDLERQAAALKAQAGDALAASPPPPLAAGQISTRTMHYVRQALDQQIEKYRDPVTKQLSGGPALNAKLELRKSLNGAMRDANPVFRAADEAYSSGTAPMDAMNAGLKAARMSSERAMRALARAKTGADRPFFEAGYAQGLIEKIGKGGSEMQNRTLQLLGPESQKSITTVLGRQRGEDFLNRLRVENLMARAKNTMSPNVGSHTAEVAGDTAAQAFHMITDMVVGGPAHVAMGAARRIGLKKLSADMLKRQQAVDAELVRLATDDPEELLRLIRQTAEKKPFDLTAPTLAGRSAVVSGTAARVQEQQQTPPQ